MLPGTITRPVIVPVAWTVTATWMITATWMTPVAGIVTAVVDYRGGGDGHCGGGKLAARQGVTRNNCRLMRNRTRLLASR